MRRNATKVAAVVMSLAVTMTSVNLPTTAAAATKKVKLNKTKATLTVGKTTTLKVTKGGKAVKATFKSNKPKIAKVVTKSGKSTKIKALKKGTAKITATYAKKKYTCKITVKAKKVTATTKPTTAPTVEPTVAPTVVPTTAPATEGAFATKKNVAKLELKLTNAYNDKHTDTVLVGTNANLQVTALDEDGKPVANAPITLTKKGIVYPSSNYARYKNLTLDTLTTDAEGHATFVYGLDESKDSQGVIDAMRTDYKASYKLTATVAGSNKSADFTVKFAALAIMSDKDDHPKNDKQIVSVVNLYEDWQGRGEVRHYLSKDGKAATTYVHSNTTANDDKTVEYVSSEKVSTTGVDNSVTFSTAAYLIIPEDEKNDKASKITLPVNETFAKGYKNYKEETFTKVFDTVDASKLQYATVNFGEVSISKHTRFELEARLLDFPTQDFDKGKFVVRKRLNDSSESNIKESNSSWQIPLKEAKGYLAVRGKVISKGQVNLDNNNGVTVKDIVGVYDKGVSSDSAKYERAEDVKIEWSNDANVNYTIPENLNSIYVDDVQDKIVDGSEIYNSKDDLKGFTYKYSVPTFPNTGNAIITVYNAKGQVYSYYSAETKNNGDNRNVIADNKKPIYKTEYKKIYAKDENGNYLKDKDGNLVEEYVKDKDGNRVEEYVKDKDGNLVIEKWEDCGNLLNLRELSEAETKQINATLTPNADSTRVTVDSQVTGVSHIVGEIKNTNPNVVIDDSNNKVYTSVHWNPINKAENKAIGYAFRGQSIKVTAQLKDMNGNDVNIAGQPVTFGCEKHSSLAEGDPIETSLAEGESTIDRAKVLSISNGGKTNANGQVDIVFAAENMAVVSDLVASTTSGYNVSFTLNGKSTDSKKLVLYWLDLDLVYNACANDDEGTPACKDSKDNATWNDDDDDDAVIAEATTTVGSKWSYGVEVKSGTDIIFEGTRYEAKIVKGVETKISVEDGYVGTATPDKANNSIELASNQNGEAKTIFQLTPNSVTNDVEVKFVDYADWKNVKTGYYAGISNTTIDKRLRLNVSWRRDQISAGNFLLPTGRYVTKGEALEAYFKLVDKYGNPVTGQTVTFKTTDNAEIKFATGGFYEKDGVVYTKTDDKYGMVKLTVSEPEGKTTILSATVDGTTYTQSYEWRGADGFKVKAEDCSYDSSKKQLVIKFTDEIVDGSITKDMLSNKYGKAIKFFVAGTSDEDNFKTYNAKDVVVSGKVLTITLPDAFNETVSNESEFVIDFTSTEIDGIEYEITSAETGEKLEDDGLTVVGGKVTIRFQ